MSSDRRMTLPEPIVFPTARSHPFDPPLELGESREQAPLRRLVYPDGHVGWLVTSYALDRLILADGRFSSRSELKRLPIRWRAADSRIGHPAPPGGFLGMDPPDHTRYRRLLTGYFTVRRVNQFTAQIEGFVRDQLDVVAQAGSPVDLVKVFALPIPLLTICELLGVPYADRDFFQRTNDVLVSLESSAEQGAEAMETMKAYLRALIEHKHRQPSDDLLSALAAAGELSDEELAGVGALVLNAGFETTANMLSLGTFALLTHPSQLQLLLSNPAKIEEAVDELLRYLTILQVSVIRTALQDVNLNGHTINAGETVTLSLPAANRDPERFCDPDELDFTRPAKGNLAFCHGVHQCLGRHLARLELKVAYPALFRRYPTLRLAIPADEVPLRTDMSSYGVHELLVAW